MERLHKVAMCNIFTINVILQIVIFAILLLTIKLLSTMDLAQKIVLSLNTSPHIFNSQENFVILTELSMNAVLVTENV